MKCPQCDRTIKLTGKNHVLIDGKLYHKKCPTEKKAVLSDEEKESWNRLRDAINYYIERDRKRSKSEYVRKNGFNWQKIMKMIKQLKKDGYSYEDQEYALHKVVAMNGIFIGYQVVVNHIAEIMSVKREDDEYRKKMKEKEDKPIIFNIPVDEIDW